jgi:hypothetical protein
MHYNWAFERVMKVCDEGLDLFNENMINATTDLYEKCEAYFKANKELKKLMEI